MNFLKGHLHNYSRNLFHVMWSIMWFNICSKKTYITVLTYPRFNSAAMHILAASYGYGVSCQFWYANACYQRNINRDLKNFYVLLGGVPPKVYIIDFTKDTSLILFATDVHSPETFQFLSNFQCISKGHEMKKVMDICFHKLLPKES